MVVNKVEKKDGKITPSQGRWVLFAAILASSMAFIDGSALNVALPALQADLNAAGADLLWIINAYLLMLASLILVGGSLGDHFGRKRIFMTGIGTFITASLVCGFAPDTLILIIARAVQGVGGALMIPGSLAIISALFPSGERGKAIGTWSAFSTITTVGGPILGGFLAEAGLWRFVFFINLPLGLVALWILYRYVPETRDETAPRELDYPGALLGIIALGGLTYGFIELGRLGPLLGWSDPTVIGSLIVGVASFILFVVTEYRSSHPMVSLSLFKSRTFSGVNLMTLFLYAALAGSLFFLPLNLVQVQGYPESVAGFTFLPFTLLLAGMSRWAGGLIDRYGPRLPLTIGPVIVGIGFMALSLPGMTAGPAEYWTTYFPGIVIIGIGMGITVAPLTTAVMGSVSSNHAGIASGVSNAVTRTAQVLATAIMGAVALAVFTSTLTTNTATIGDLTAADRIAIEAEAQKLGDASVPETIPDSRVDEVQRAIDESFIATFRLIMTIAALLCWLSALLAGIIVERRLSPPADEPELASGAT